MRRVSKQVVSGLFKSVVPSVAGSGLLVLCATSGATSGAAMVRYVMVTLLWRIKDE